MLFHLENERGSFGMEKCNILSLGSINGHTGGNQAVFPGSFLKKVWYGFILIFNMYRLHLISMTPLFYLQKEYRDINIKFLRTLA